MFQLFMLFFLLLFFSFVDFIWNTSILLFVILKIMSSSYIIKGAEGVGNIIAQILLTIDFSSLLIIHFLNSQQIIIKFKSIQSLPSILEFFFCIKYKRFYINWIIFLKWQKKKETHWKGRKKQGDVFGLSQILFLLLRNAMVFLFKMWIPILNFYIVSCVMTWCW